MPITKLKEGLPNQSMPQQEFDQAMGKLMAEFPPWAAEASALEDNVNQKEASAVQKAAEASASAQAAAASAVAAASATAATVWALGANYPQYAAVISPADGMTYRCLVAVVASPIEPALDDGNTWAPISGISFDDAVALSFFF